jgi:hypothetical protein
MVNLTSADIFDNAGAQLVLDAIRARWPWPPRLERDEYRSRRAFDITGEQHSSARIFCSGISERTVCRLRIGPSRIWPSDPAIDALVRAFTRGILNRRGDAY